MVVSLEPGGRKIPAKNLHQKLSTTNSKRLEHGIRVLCAGFSFFLLFWDQRTVIFRLSGFYCRS